MAIVSRLVVQQDDSLLDVDDWMVPNEQLLFDTAMLERYILLCAQEIQGGLRDKPSKPRDFYHTCYNLSGLSIAQLSGIDYGHTDLSKVATTHPIYNIRIERACQVRKYFSNLQQ